MKMGISYAVEIFVGASLSEDEIFGLFHETKTSPTIKIYDVCPKDHPNPSRNKYCGGCGRKLEYEEQPEGPMHGDGVLIQHNGELENLGLEGIAVNAWYETDSQKQVYLIGKKYLSCQDPREVSFQIDEVHLSDLEKVMKETKNKFSKLGLKKEPQVLHVVRSY